MDFISWECPWMNHGIELCRAILEIPTLKRIDGIEYKCIGLSAVEPKLYMRGLNKQE